MRLRKWGTALVLLAASHAAPALAGGTDTGGTGEGSAYSAYVSEWCRGNKAILDQFATAANLADLNGDSESVIRLLKQGLREALKHGNGEQFDGSLTYRAIDRGLKIANALQALEAVDPNAIEAERAFLLNYYDFVNYISDNIDVEIYIPYEYIYKKSKNSGDFDLNKFEARFIEYAQKQVDWFLTTFTSPAWGGGVAPQFSEKADLKILEFITLHMAQDVTDSLSRTKYGCSIDILLGLNKNLAEHNLGNKTIYGNDRYALNIVAGKIKKLAKGLGRPEDCKSEKLERNKQ